MRVQDNIRHWREYRNYSQAYMGAQLGISQQAYQLTEAGITQLTKVVEAKIAAILEIEPDMLYRNTPLNELTETEKEMYERLLRDKEQQLREEIRKGEQKDRIIQLLLRDKEPSIDKIKDQFKNNGKI